MDVRSIASGIRELRCPSIRSLHIQKLLTLKITEQYPDYKVQTTSSGNLLVKRPGKDALTVDADADAIGHFCRRGPKDCNYSIDQMLLELGGK